MSDLMEVGIENEKCLYVVAFPLCLGTYRFRFLQRRKTEGRGWGWAMRIVEEAERNAP